MTLKVPSKVVVKVANPDESSAYCEISQLRVMLLFKFAFYTCAYIKMPYNTLKNPVYCCQ